MHRGERLVEILKQPQYQPLPVEAQVVVLFAAGRGYFDGMAAEDVSNCEKELLRSLKADKPELLAEIAKTGKITTELERLLEEACAAIVSGFKA